MVKVWGPVKLSGVMSQVLVPSKVVEPAVSRLQPLLVLWVGYRCRWRCGRCRRCRRRW